MRVSERVERVMSCTGWCMAFHLPSWILLFGTGCLRVYRKYVVSPFLFLFFPLVGYLDGWIGCIGLAIFQLLFLRLLEGLWRVRAEFGLDWVCGWRRGNWWVQRREEGGQWKS